MFARSLTFHLKPNCTAEFTRLIENETVPALRKYKGFQDELTFVDPGGKDGFAVSLWDKKEYADAYSRDGYAAVLKAFGKVIEGTPQVHTYEVSNSTFHKIAARVMA